MVIKRIKKLIPSTESLLREFILGRFKEHQDILDTIRENRTGFSPDKLFVAHLIGITRHKLGDIAEVMKLNYGTLRQWKLEESFNAASDEALHSFASTVSAFMKEEIEKQAKSDKYSYPAPGQEFADAALYNRRLIEKIADSYFKTFPGITELLGFVPDMVIEYAESVFGRYYRNVGKVWEKEHLTWIINRFMLENTDILFSEDSKIWVSRMMLDDVLNVLLQHLKNSR